MNALASNASSKIKIRLATYHDCDDVQLFWRTTVNGQVDGVIPDCLGFSIERQRKLKNNEWGNIEVLRNRVGFSSDKVDTKKSGLAGISQPSTIWPFQTYEWTDHGANAGNTVRYRVVAVRLPAGGVAGTSKLEPIVQSKWSQAIAVTADCGNGVSAYFNRGAVMSQYVARIARQNNWGPKDIKEHVKELEEPIRRFLAGDLRLALLRLLDEVIDDPALEIYAALYELLDEEMIRRLKLLRQRAHIVLANGSDKTGDENAAARTALNAAKVDVRDRMLGSKGLGHNKFAVAVHAQDRKPYKVWSGSTNWSPSGLCTQLNNGILIDNEDVGQIYFDQWTRLADAQNGFPDQLVAENAKSPRTSGTFDVWFTRIRNPSKKNVGLGADLQTLIDYVNHAQDIILYVMFQPGPEPLGSILKRASTLYVRGVVSTVTSATEEKFSLMGIATTSKEYHTALVQPEGIEKGFSAWVAEVTRQQFLYPPQNPGIGHAITHAKMIVIDPFSEDCKVITGSHNFSQSASERNDENFVVIHGNKELAQAYTVACLMTYAHYRWRAYVKDQLAAGKEVWDHLSDKPEWQQSYLTPALKNELALWCK